MIKKIFYILTLCLITAPVTMGQSISAFTTYPTKTINQDKWIVRDVNPGRHYREQITIENLSDENIELKIDIVESTGGRENIRLLENSTYQPIKQWIKSEQDIVKLSPFEKKNINLNIQVPGNQELGEYQAVALVSQTSEKSGNLKISTRIGNRIYLNVTDQKILQTNTFNSEINPPQITLIILSLIAITYSFMPAKKPVKK